MVAKLLFYLAKNCYMLPLLLLLIHRFYILCVFSGAAENKEPNLI